MDAPDDDFLRGREIFDRLAMLEALWSAAAREMLDAIVLDDPRQA